MPDLIFKHPKLVKIYDLFDGERADLIHYLEIAREFSAETIIDLGSGTGCFAAILADSGFNVIAVEPALASLEYAKTLRDSARIEWHSGDASSLRENTADIAFMTGNVAQVFLSDQEWMATLRALFNSIRTGGHLVFEARKPEIKAWYEWTKEKTFCLRESPEFGTVESWCEVTDVTEDLVSFRWNYHFIADGEVLTSESTLRFRSKDEYIKSLHDAGFIVDEIREAPDRLGKEFVFITRKI